MLSKDDKENLSYFLQVLTHKTIKKKIKTTNLHWTLGNLGEDGVKKELSIYLVQLASPTAIL